nr:MAG TPA: hypothetical protein [Caudoviricetes sp.]DAY37690.1 MAG TPA: hypothetical protein [Caudoviricetes sp.]
MPPTPSRSAPVPKPWPPPKRTPASVWRRKRRGARSSPESLP